MKNKIGVMHKWERESRLEIKIWKMKRAMIIFSVASVGLLAAHFFGGSHLPDWAYGSMAITMMAQNLLFLAFKIGWEQELKGLRS